MKWCFPHDSPVSFCFLLSPGQQVRKLVKDGLIIRKPVTVHSRARCRKNTLARRKGRHMGVGTLNYNVYSVLFKVVIRLFGWRLCTSNLTALLFISQVRERVQPTPVCQRSWSGCVAWESCVVFCVATGRPRRSTGTCRFRTKLLNIFSSTHLFVVASACD